MSKASRPSSLFEDTIYSFSDLPSCHTFNADGVNIDYLLYIQYDDSSRKTASLEFPITKLYDAVFQQIVSFYHQNDFGEGGLDVVRYLETTGLVEMSEELSQKVSDENFNYCVDISDRYQPKLLINIKAQLNIFLNNIRFLRELDAKFYFYKAAKQSSGHALTKEGDLSVVQRNSLQEQAAKSYSQAINLCNKDICVYLILWLHAYRFSQSRIACLQNPKNKMFSHRYYGWSQPKYSLDEGFQIEFKTNFGFGYSSYFYLVMYYKDVQIFNFLDWVDYGKANLSQMQKYSVKYTNESLQDEEEEGDDDTGRQDKKHETISNKLWIRAIRDANNACALYLDDEDKFVKEHIIDNLEGMIARLEKIIDTEDSEINSSYRGFEYKFSKYCVSKEEIIRSKSMSVKGYMISGVLSFISEILKLENIFSVNSYLERIFSLNKKLQPMLELEAKRNEATKLSIEKEVNSNREKMITIWTVGNGTLSLKDLTYMKKKSSLSSEDNVIYEKLQSEHESLSLRSSKVLEDYDNVKTILRNIKRYSVSIEQYFNNN